MEKIQKPKRLKSLTASHSFEESHAEDPYVYGQLFENMTIVDSYIEKLSFDQCHLKNVTFKFHEPIRIDFSDTTFENCDLSQLKLVDGSIFRCEFVNCRLTGTDFTEVNIRHTLFEMCSAQYSYFTNSKFKQVNVNETKLSDVMFNECQFEKIAFNECDFSTSEFMNTRLKGLDLSTCDLTGAKLPLNYLSGLTVNQEQAIELAKGLGLTIV